MNLFFNNLFGTIAGSGILNHAPAGIGFIPKDKDGNTIQIRGVNATWLGMKNAQMQKYAYEFCYPVSCVVDTLAELDLTGERQLLRKGGKGKNNFATSTFANSLNKLFDRPNPLQSWEQFRGQQVVYRRLFGYCPVLIVKRAGFGPEDAMLMMNLPPWLFEAVPTNKLVYQNDIKDVVKEYKCNLLGSTLSFPPEDVLILEDSFMQDEDKGFLLPQSRLVGLDMAISNICAAMEANNVLLKKRGPLGFISHDAGAVKDAVAGYLPMTKQEKEEVQDALQAYGMSWDQYQYVISRTAMRWNPMSFDVKQLGITDTVVLGSKAICRRMNFPYVLFEEIDATYANGSNAHKSVYQNNVIPNNRKDFKKYEQYFKMQENNVVFVCDYSELPVLQEDELNKGQAANAQTQALERDWLNGMITRNQWLEARGYERLPDEDPRGEEYYVAPEPTIKDENKDFPPKD